MSRYEVPCEQETFRTAVEAIKHAAGCARCTQVQRAREATPDGPVSGSLKTRMEAAQGAATTAGNYIEHASTSADSRQVQRLLMAIARLESALYFETQGRFGHEHAHATAVLERERRQT